jgi:hypothetical protein
MNNLMRIVVKKYFFNIGKTIKYKIKWIINRHILLMLMKYQVKKKGLIIGGVVFALVLVCVGIWVFFFNEDEPETPTNNSGSSGTSGSSGNNNIGTNNTPQVFADGVSCTSVAPDENAKTYAYAGSGCVGNKYCVSTTRSKSRDGNSGSWQIIKS